MLSAAGNAATMGKNQNKTPTQCKHARTMLPTMQVNNERKHAHSEQTTRTHRHRRQELRRTARWLALLALVALVAQRALVAPRLLLLLALAEQRQLGRRPW
jgi:hypothetical protein